MAFDCNARVFFQPVINVFVLNLHFDIILFFTFQKRSAFPALEMKTAILFLVQMCLVEAFTMMVYASVSFIPIGSSTALYILVELISGYLVGWFIDKRQNMLVKSISVTISAIGGILIVYELINNGHSNSDLINRNHIVQNINWTINSSVAANNQSHVISSNSMSTPLNSWLNGTILAVFSGLVGAGANVVANQLNKANIHQAQVAFSSFFSQTIISVILMLFLEHLKLHLSMTDALLIFGHCIFGALTVIAFYITVAYGDLILVSLISTLEIPMREFAQYLLFPDLQPQQTGWMDVTGCLFVLAAILLLPLDQLYKKYKDALRENSTEEEMEIMILKHNNNQ